MLCADLPGGAGDGPGERNFADVLAAATSPATGTLSSKTEVAPVFPLVNPDTPGKVPENPFATADPAVRESFERAKAAYEIGNYPSVLAELQVLATNAQLNWQQKYAVQALLDKTPRNAPSSSAAPSLQPSKR